jgi:EAL domain-containing protein (putative c-di-GMP-specific phosphodiesterase class I)
VSDDPEETTTGAPRPGVGWYLETLADAGRLRRIAIDPLPFRVGRRHGLALVLPFDSVSKNHAEIYETATGLGLRDLGSKNGTFVNRSLIDDTSLEEGDIIHFADSEFRLGRASEKETAPLTSGDDRPTTKVPKRRELSHHFAEGTRELRELLSDGMVTMVFQPIILLPRREGQTPAAYEALGRGRHPRLPESPIELFRIAESIGAEAELSRLFRRKAIELATELGEAPTIFLNTHPIELERPGLLESLEELRELAPLLDLALEIHESVLTRPAQIAELRALLRERNIALAYDDFGAGQARLLELADAPPDYLKFDRRWVSDLDQATVSKRRLLSSLLSLARDLPIRTVAEGIETPAEAAACSEMGFTHAQGFHLGRPRPLEQPPLSSPPATAPPGGGEKK